MNSYDDERRVAKAEFAASKINIELDSLDDGILADCFIRKVYKSVAQFDADRVIDITNGELTFTECLYRAAIGLYALKDVYSTIEINVYGIRYTFELMKYALPNKKDFLIIQETISSAIMSICNGRSEVAVALNEITNLIKEDKLKFEL